MSERVSERVASPERADVQQALTGVNQVVRRPQTWRLDGPVVLVHPQKYGLGAPSAVCAAWASAESRTCLPRACADR